MACAECLILRRQNKVLRERIAQLRITLRDMGFEEPAEADTMYEDEMPLVPWGDDR
jgi:hypothetical protein